MVTYTRRRRGDRQRRSSWSRYPASSAEPMATSRSTSPATARTAISRSRTDGADVPARRSSIRPRRRRRRSTSRTPARPPLHVQMEQLSGDTAFTLVGHVAGQTIPGGGSHDFIVSFDPITTGPTADRDARARQRRHAEGPAGRGRDGHARRHGHRSRRRVWPVGDRPRRRSASASRARSPTSCRTGLQVIEHGSDEHVPHPRRSPWT